MRNMKGFWSFVLRFGLSGGILWFIFSKIDMRTTVEVLKTAEIGQIVIAFVIFLFLHFLLLWRWSIFMKAMNLHFKLFTAVRYFFIGLFCNLFLPTSIGGDIVKAAGLARETHNKTAVVASVLLDRLSGFVAIVIVAMSAFVFGFGIIRNIYLGIPVAVLAIGCGTIAVILFNEKVYAFACRIFNKLPRFKKALMDMHKDVLLLREHPGKGWQAVAISCVTQGIFALTYYFCARAMHQDIPVVYFWVFVPLICVICSLPSIGGLGVREAGTAYLFSKIGVEPGIAVSMSLLNFLFMVLTGSIGGIMLMVTGFKLSEAAQDKDMEAETIL